MICPFCGGENKEGAHLCKWCHAELTDLSDSRHEAKKAYVKTQTMHLKYTPIKIAKLMTCTFLVLALVVGIGGTIFSISTGKTIKSMTYDFKISSLNRKLDHYYKNHDYHNLALLIIDEVHTSLSSEKYFAYRRALFTYWYQSDFEKAQDALQTADAASEKNKAIAQMCIAYKNLNADALEQAENIQMGYSYIDEIDVDFNKELQHQAEVLSGLLDYDLNKMATQSDSTLNETNWSNYIN